MEKTLTFTVEDALLSPISFAMLSGAGVVKGASNTTDKVHVHMTTTATVDSNNRIDLTDALGSNTICDTAPVFVMGVETGDGSLDGSLLTGTVGKTDISQGPAAYKYITLTNATTAGTVVMVDYYITKNSAKVTELQIDMQHFAGYYYVEADTLFRASKDGQDYPANITLPNVKIQSNWTFSMAATGDPSTFTFTMDAMPGYTYFDQTKKVLCVILVVEDIDATNEVINSVMAHKDNEETYITSDDVVPYDSTDNIPGVNEQYTKVAANAEYSSSTTYYYRNGNIYKAATDVTDANFSTKKGSLYTKNT